MDLNCLQILSVMQMLKFLYEQLSHVLLLRVNGFQHILLSRLSFQ